MLSLRFSEDVTNDKTYIVKLCTCRRRSPNPRLLLQNATGNKHKLAAFECVWHRGVAGRTDESLSANGDCDDVPSADDSFTRPRRSLRN